MCLVDPTAAIAWRYLGIAGGGKVSARINYSKATCFEDSLKLDPTHVIALRYLGSTGGDNVSARTNDQAGPDSSRPGYYHRVKIDYASSLIIPGA